MPSFDRTGPGGEGPRTGRGLGKCGKAGMASNPRPGRSQARKQGYGSAAGRGGRTGGKGRGGGRGRGRM